MVLLDAAMADAGDDHVPDTIPVLPTYRPGKLVNKLREEAIIAAQVATRDSARRSADFQDAPTSHLQGITCRIDTAVFRATLDPQNPIRSVANAASYVNRLRVNADRPIPANHAIRQGQPSTWLSHHVSAADFAAHLTNSGCHIVDVQFPGSNGIMIEVAFCPTGHLVGGVDITLADMKRDNDKMVRSSLGTGEDLERTIIVQFSRFHVMFLPVLGPRPPRIRARDVTSFITEADSPLIVIKCEHVLVDENQKSANAARRVNY